MPWEYEKYAVVLCIPAVTEPEYSLQCLQ